MLFLNFRGDDHHDDDHDDMGGLHRDLLETGAAMDRRRMLRTTARLGVALGAIPLLGCAGDASSITGSDTSGTAGPDTTGGSANCVARIPEETTVPSLATARMDRTRSGRPASCAATSARASAA